ncbi:MAG: hypothetical protein ACI37P_03195 [Eggerthellaceae bacterium]
MSDRIDEIKEQAQKAASNDGALRDLIEDLAGPSRRNRQHAASVMNALSKQSPETVVPFIGNLVDALELKEAQTRWESLDALSSMVAVQVESCDEAVPGAESALFDEDNGLLHLAALRFLCTIGAVSEDRSLKVWPLIDEAVQCYHGDAEFLEMLAAVNDFALGNIDPSVKEALSARMAFDAKNSRGALQRRAASIVEACA